MNNNYEEESRNPSLFRDVGPHIYTEFNSKGDNAFNMSDDENTIVKREKKDRNTIESDMPSNEMKRRRVTEQISIVIENNNTSDRDLNENTVRKKYREPRNISNNRVFLTVLNDKWEEFKLTQTYKRVKSKIILIMFAVVCLVWLYSVFSERQVIHNNTYYGYNSKCEIPLVPFVFSPLKMGNKIDDVVFNAMGMIKVEESLEISECYLNTYPENVSCITPLAYGNNVKMISMRQSDGNIKHLLNPFNMVGMGKKVNVPETSSFFPDHKPIYISRYMQIRIDYTDRNMKDNKTDIFDAPDSFCIASSMDTFNYILHQFSEDLGDEQQKP